MEMHGITIESNVTPSQLRRILAVLETENVPFEMTVKKREIQNIGHLRTIVIESNSPLYFRDMLDKLGGNEL